MRKTELSKLKERLVMRKAKRHYRAKRDNASCFDETFLKSFAKEFYDVIIELVKEGKIEVKTEVKEELKKVSWPSKEEVIEECGYDVEVSKFKSITSTWASVGTNAARQTIFYVEVDESQRVNSGGGIDDEDIEVVFIKAKEVEKVIFDENIVLTPGAKFALLWWIYKKGI